MNPARTFPLDRSTTRRHLPHSPPGPLRFPETTTVNYPRHLPQSPILSSLSRIVQSEYLRKASLSDPPLPTGASESTVSSLSSKFETNRSEVPTVGDWEGRSEETEEV